MTRADLTEATRWEIESLPGMEVVFSTLEREGAANEARYNPVDDSPLPDNRRAGIRQYPAA